MTTSTYADTEYEGHDLSTIREPVLMVAKAKTPGVFSQSGVVALTTNNLLFLVANQGVTRIERDSKRSDITDVSYDGSVGTIDTRFLGKFEVRTPELRFKDGSNRIRYTHDGDDLEQFYLPLHDSAQVNEHQIRRQELQQEANRSSTAGIIWSADGDDGTVNLYEDRLSILRLTYDTHSEIQKFRGTDIMIHALSSIQWVEAGQGSGYIQFDFDGLDNSPEAKQDMTVCFSQEQQPHFDILRRYIADQRAEVSRPYPAEVDVHVHIDGDGIRVVKE